MDEARRRTISYAVLFGALALGLTLIVLSAVIPGFGVIEGRHDIVDVGETIDTRISSRDNERANITVTELHVVSLAERAEWDFDNTIGLDGLGDDDDLYIVRFEYDGDPPLGPSMWRLLDADDFEHASTVVKLPGEAECPALFGDDGRGCAVVIVPAGTQIAMVRYYGVETPYYRGKPIGAEIWEGWRV